MKRKINLSSIYIILVLLVAFSACKKSNESNPFIKSTNHISKTTDLYDMAGNNHNMALAHLMMTHTFDKNDTANHSFMINSIINMLNASPNTDLHFTGIDSINLNLILSDYFGGVYLNSIENIFNLVDTFSGIGFAEKTHIFDVKEVYDSLIAVTDTFEALEYFQEYVDDKIEIFENTTWSSGQGEAVGGYLYVLKHTSQFWYNEILADPTTYDGLDLMAIIQFDAAGYLFGWTKAWLYDQLPTPEERIHAGKGVAATASFMRFLGKVLK